MIIPERSGSRFHPMSSNGPVAESERLEFGIRGNHLYIVAGSGPPMAQAEAETDVIANVDLTDNEYEMVGGIIRRKWKVLSTDGDVILRAKQKLFKLKEEFPFVDDDGNPVFRVKAEGIIDTSGDYVITEEGSEDVIAVLHKDFTILKHIWHIHAPDGEEWAVIESRSAFVQAMRHLVKWLRFLPHKYTIETPDGESIGVIDGQFTLLKDKYDIVIEDPHDIPKEALVAAAIAVDALETQ